ncbi:hypothetical protein QYE76_041932 [Lolium multiflorum]|uniref:Reverse transcriptase domain-containing protein n=1 Tax=Lolium multiflorum TaxID=4521 RepID=A0AAD8TEB0_LOLMU|nr:hypothetical protein QYE76_041932 [Lolium multiflorum]
MARQRAKIAWLREGDANTAFFHQHAAYRHQKNVIHSLRVDNAVVSDHAAMAEATFAHFEGLLGTSVARDHSLYLEFLCVTPEDLPELEVAFTEEEADFMAAFDKLYTMCGQGFQGLNQALMVLLPKRPDATALGDYRPISLIHIFAKLVAKILATRLAPRMESLVDRNQCAFIRKRCIHDNFMLVQQTARFLHREKEPRVMLKLDIARAFDSVSWGFLMEVLQRIGFGPRFRELVSLLLATASTRVLLNGEQGPLIWHRRGLRQGDPLSPSLFVLVMNSLNKVLAKVIRVQRQHKDYLDACSEGSFTSKEVEARWDLLDRIEENAEGWENNKGEESGYADKPPFKPLPPKEGNEEKEKKKKKGTKKKKKKENKEKEAMAYPRVYEVTIELSAVRDILELFGQASGLRTNFAKCSVSPIACSEEEAGAAAVHMECQLAPFPVKYLARSRCSGGEPRGSEGLPAFPRARARCVAMLSTVRKLLVAVARRGEA